VRGKHTEVKIKIKNSAGGGSALGGKNRKEGEIYNG
jgi:hypothetical protein